jgi:general secretion pathway protein H
VDERGFTLIEMLVALGIAAVLVGAAFSMLPQRSSTLDVAGAARRMAANLREARSAAIAGNRPVDVPFDVADGHGLTLELVTTEGLRQGATVGSIRFFPDGGSSGGGIVVSTGRQHARVMVDWLSGSVSVAFDDAP